MSQFRTLGHFAPHRVEIEQQPTVKTAAIGLSHGLTARLDNPYLVRDAKAVMQPGETPDALFVRLLLYYLHNERAPGDTALVEAMARMESAVTQ